MNGSAWQWRSFVKLLDSLVKVTIATVGMLGRSHYFSHPWNVELSDKDTCVNVVNVFGTKKKLGLLRYKGILHAAVYCQGVELPFSTFFSYFIHLLILLDKPASEILSGPCMNGKPFPLLQKGGNFGIYPFQHIPYVETHYSRRLPEPLPSRNRFGSRLKGWGTDFVFLEQQTTIPYHQRLLVDVPSVAKELCQGLCGTALQETQIQRHCRHMELLFGS